MRLRREFIRNGARQADMAEFTPCGSGGYFRASHVIFGPVLSFKGDFLEFY